MTHAQIYEKLNSLREKYKDNDSQEKLNQFEKSLKESEIRITLSEIKELKLLIETLMLKVDEANNELRENRELNDLQRAVLFERKDIYNSIIDWFMSPAQVKDTIEAIIKDIQV